ncbi:MAG: hypothetical protein IPP71_11585 [Bacteroidetes bacterium]|nr:hypothetical protein [Bacteroidota bacterium]
MRNVVLIVFALLINVLGYSQKTNNVWCFGDSAGINFNNANILTGTSNVKSRGSAISIADSSGQLLFYAFTRAEF